MSPCRAFWRAQPFAVVLLGLVALQGAARAQDIDAGAARAESADGGVPRAELTDGGVTRAELTDGGVPRAELTDGGVTRAELTDGGVAREAKEEIEVVGQRPAASVRAPGAAGTVIEMSRYGGEVRSVAELLSTAPGVSVHALGGPGQAATLSLRGATADESLVLLDGIPLQGPGGGAVDLSTLPATLLGRMVVSRGVLGAQLGAGALGGAVELVPRAATSHPTGGAEVSGGSFGTAQLAADGEAPVGDQGSVLAAVQLDRTGGAFDYARQLTPEIAGSPYYGFTRQNADAKRASGLLRLSGQLSPATELDFIAQGSLGDRGLPGPSTATTPRSRALDAGGVAGVRLQGSAGEASWALRTWGRVERLELRGVQLFSDCQDGSPDCPRQRETSSTARAEAEASLPLGEALRLRLVASGGEEWISGAATGAHRRALASASLAADAHLPGRVALHPAVRVDRAGVDTGVSPGLTATWRPSATLPLELRAGTGLSFRPASFSELYLDQGAVQPNPALTPERAFSLDAGATLRTGRLTLSAGAFWSRYRDLIIYELFPPARVKPFNLGLARIAGVELQAVVELPAGFVGEVTYSYLDAINLREGAQGGHRLSYRPPHRLFGRLARRGDRLEGYFEGNWTSAMPRNQFDTASLPPQLLLNAGAGVRIAGPLWLDVEAKNLLDDQTHEDLFQYPLPGLSLSVIARARF